MSSRSVFSAGPLAALTGLGHLSRRKAREAEASHPPLGEFVNIEGKRVHFVRMGTGPAVILIHGAGGNLRDFTFELAGKMAADAAPFVPPSRPVRRARCAAWRCSNGCARFWRR